MEESFNVDVVHVQFTCDIIFHVLVSDTGYYSIDKHDHGLVKIRS
jgi:hypothetical protein